MILPTAKKKVRENLIVHIIVMLNENKSRYKSKSWELVSS